MDKKTNKNGRGKKRNIDDFEIEQDENFSFIAGYISAVLQLIQLVPAYEIYINIHLCTSIDKNDLTGIISGYLHRI